MSSTLIGIVAATQLKKRSAFFSSMVNFMKSLFVEIEYSMSDMPSLVIKLSETDLCKNLYFLNKCTSLLNEGADFPLAWERAVEENTGYIKAEEKDKLLSFGMSLGTTDLQGQKRMINLFTEHFESYRTDAKQTEEKYYRIYILTGILLGFVAFILLI